MKNSTTTATGLIALVCLVNAGFQSTGSKEDPAINFFGVVEVNGSSDQAKNITISQLYENIKMYGIPASPETAPTTNVTLLRLDDIKKITGLPTGQNIKTFKQREYVEIQVQLTSGQTKNYLVERSRKLYYDVPTSDPSLQPLEKEVAMEAVKKVTIQGFKQKERTTEKPGALKDKSAAQEALCANAKKNITELEKESKGIFASTVESIKESIYYLCS